MAHTLYIDSEAMIDEKGNYKIFQGSSYSRSYGSEIDAYVICAYHH
jgi:hypothetical protein